MDRQTITFVVTHKRDHIFGKLREQSITSQMIRVRGNCKKFMMMTRHIFAIIKETILIKMFRECHKLNTSESS